MLLFCLLLHNPCCQGLPIKELSFISIDLRCVFFKHRKSNYLLRKLFIASALQSVVPSNVCDLIYCVPLHLTALYMSVKLLKSYFRFAWSQKDYKVSLGRCYTPHSFHTSVAQHSHQSSEQIAKYSIPKLFGFV